MSKELQQRKGQKTEKQGSGEKWSESRAELHCPHPLMSPRETTPVIQSYLSFPLSHVLNTSDPIFLEKDLKNSLGTKSKHSWEPGDFLGISLMNFTWIPLLIGGNFHPSVMRNFQCCKVSLGLSFSRTNCISLCSAGPYLQERTSYYPYHI